MFDRARMNFFLIPTNNVHYHLFVFILRNYLCAVGHH